MPKSRGNIKLKSISLKKGLKPDFNFTGLIEVKKDMKPW